MAYKHENLKIGLRSLQYQYPFADFFSIGKSVMGKDLYCIRLGQGERRLICVGAHHSLEWLTSIMLLNITEGCLKAYVSKQPLYDYNMRELFKTSSIYIIPMLNPDGIDLAAGRIEEDNYFYQNVVNLTGGGVDFAGEWQANIHGVDLNHNYDAYWYEAMSMKETAKRPAPTRYAGPYPESEPESQALAQFTRDIWPDAVIAYHSQGEEIYYDFMGKLPRGAKKLAEELAEISGYRLLQPQGFAGFGGYKDWFIDRFDRPGFTIEIGTGKNPIGFDQLAKAVRVNIPVILRAAAWEDK